MPERARGGPVAFAVRPVTCRTVIAEDLGAVHGKSNLPVLAGKNQWENAAEEQFARYRDLRNVSPGCSALNIGESTPFSCLFVCELQQHLKRAGGAAIAHFFARGYENRHVSDTRREKDWRRKPCSGAAPCRDRALSC